jgi:hypothetical protein
MKSQSVLVLALFLPTLIQAQTLLIACKDANDLEEKMGNPLGLFAYVVKAKDR